MSLARRFATALLIALLSSLALAQTPQESKPTLPPAPNAQVTTVADAPPYANEPSIAVNAKNPQQLVGAYQARSSVIYSQDAGKTWQHAAPTGAKDYKVSGDVSVTYDNRGHALLCYIAFDRLGAFNYWASGATRNAILVRRSLDGGATWEADEHEVIAQPTKPGIPFEDKPIIVADNTNSKFAGNLYVGWTEFTLTETRILFARSTDGGVSWSSPIDISTHHGLPRDDNGAVEGFDAAIGPDGSIYAVWSDGDDIAFVVSHDGGKTFQKSRAAIHAAPMYFALAGMERANGFPQIGIDNRHGQHGRLYVSWTDYRNGDVDVFVAHSDDEGATWSEPVRVNTDAMHNGSDQFFQWLAVDPVDNSVNVIFYDPRSDDPRRRGSVAVTLARSTDNGATFKNYAWTTEPFRLTSDAFLGDYSGLAALNGRVYGIWAEFAPLKAEDAKAPVTQSAQPPSATPPRVHAITKIGVADFSK